MIYCFQVDSKWTKKVAKSLHDSNMKSDDPDLLPFLLKKMDMMTALAVINNLEKLEK